MRVKEIGAFCMNRRSRLLAILCAVIISACAKTTVFFFPNPSKGAIKPRTADQVAILYDGPGRPYDVLGVLQAKRYQPGMSDPVLTDVLPEIRIKAGEAGADAIIIRQGNAANRVIDIHAEVIKFRD
jgi:hypothetical protein